MYSKMLDKHKMWWNNMSKETRCCEREADMSIKISRCVDIISKDERATISNRYHKITKAINQEFWNSSSDTLHSIYVGSYGRGTAISSSDIDMLVEIPEREFKRYDFQKGNGQSRFLQAVKNAIVGAFPHSDIHADGQVVVIDFKDAIKFEVVPAFRNEDWLGNVTYTYPDSNMGGNWKSTNPKAEQEAINEKDKNSGGLLKDTCKVIRFVRDNYYTSYHLSGILIDAFAYDAIQGWYYLSKGEQSFDSGITYEQALLNYYNKYPIPVIFAPGSKMLIDISKGWDVLGKILKRMVD